MRNPIRKSNGTKRDDTRALNEVVQRLNELRPLQSKTIKIDELTTGTLMEVKPVIGGGTADEGTWT